MGSATPAPVPGPAPAPEPAPVPETVEGRIRTALSGVLDPEIRKPITELEMVRSVCVDRAGHARVQIALTIVGCPAARTIEREVAAAVRATAGVESAEIVLGVMTAEERAALTAKLRGARPARAMPFGPDSLTRVYAITSGKGGVGKSTLTANLAVALADTGLAVGVIDADVYGFSIPGILGLVHDGITTAPTRLDEMILPPVAHGVKAISIGMFLDPAHGANGSAVAWRGPMLHRTLNQFLTDVYFGDLDVLLLDLPPGTGDMAISLGQILPNADVIVVTTPQPAAADVAERSGALARQTGQHVVGVIETMAGLSQPDGSVLDLFGSGGGAQVAQRLSAGRAEAVPLLASIPFSVALREAGDGGTPIVIAAPDDPASLAIRQVARRLAARPRGLAGKRLAVAPVQPR